MKHKIIFSAIAALFLLFAATQTMQAKHRCRGNSHCNQNRGMMRPMIRPQVRVVIAPPMMRRPQCGTRVQNRCCSYNRGMHRGHHKACNNRQGNYGYNNGYDNDYYRQRDYRQNQDEVQYRRD